VDSLAEILLEPIHNILWVALENALPIWFSNPFASSLIIERLTKERKGIHVHDGH
jgi:hypothetical protein